MKHHCYIGAYESVYTSDVEAGTPAEAAEKAAAEHHISGKWTVVPGEPLSVAVAKRSSYEAVEPAIAEAPGLAVEVVNGNPGERILVIAPSHQRFTRWCAENGVNPRARNVLCATRHDHLRGISSARYVYLGTANGGEGDHLRDLFDHLKAMRGWKSAEVTMEIADGPHA